MAVVVVVVVVEFDVVVDVVGKDNGAIAGIGGVEMCITRLMRLIRIRVKILLVKVKN